MWLGKVSMNYCMCLSGNWTEWRVKSQKKAKSFQERIQRNKKTESIFDIKVSLIPTPHFYFFYCFSTSQSKIFIYLLKFQKNNHNNIDSNSHSFTQLLAKFLFEIFAV